MGVISMGIECPIIRKGDDLRNIVIGSILSKTSFEDGDIVGITESIVARAEGNYITIDDIAEETTKMFGKNAIIRVMFPIYSRNRFSMILKGIARSAKMIIFHGNKVDEVGNPDRVNVWTGVDIMKYYKNIVESQNCIFCHSVDTKFRTKMSKKEYEGYIKEWMDNKKYLICNLHGWEVATTLFQDGKVTKTLADYFRDKCEYGLLGSNKANEETLKLFPSKAYSNKLVNDIKKYAEGAYGKSIEVMVYGDGCFKDPDTHIWEFADPVASPAFTDGLSGSPNEIKLKAFADDPFFKDLNGIELENAIKEQIVNKDNNLVGNMAAQGTTPRRYVNLLASLMDLTSGSGDRGTPVVLVRNYFKNYADA